MWFPFEEIYLLVRLSSILSFYLTEIWNNLTNRFRNLPITWSFQGAPWQLMKKEKTKFQVHRRLYCDVWHFFQPHWSSSKIFSLLESNISDGRYRSGKSFWICNLRGRNRRLDSNSIRKDIAFKQGLEWIVLCFKCWDQPDLEMWGFLFDLWFQNLVIQFLTGLDFMKGQRRQ